ncbi:hypothetical protein DYD21_10065 [Rhodohalobacter sp. SW132]|uniref:hypothetical protein n=1 Tax=Rhodohalobacter sp. SW132 TaxID=2293433 RepID=UPI000E239605|nr:hypothetical protein [Rhodohalobacter sp. SW132]REL33741.1 hypothetical protein DYD21_10065 [Rhodohalobacter sp. SW132]
MGVFWGFLIILIVVVLIILISTFFSIKKKEKAKNIDLLQRMASATNNYARKIESVKTTSSKIKNCEKAIEVLEQASRYPECRDVFTNYDSLMNQLHSTKLVLPVTDYLQKADKHKFKGNEKSEKSSLLDALYEIKTSNITDEHFKIAEVRDDETGELLTENFIKSRLKELGWKEN